jgi:hypothetical protein
MKSAAILTKSPPRQTAHSSAYEKDFHAWLLAQVSALRERRFRALDLENLLEEVEELAQSLARELRTRLKVVLVHLLKGQFQPSKRSSSRDLSLLEQRDQLGQLLEQNPSLRRQVPELIQKAYVAAEKTAAKEMKLDSPQWQRTFPAQCPWTPEQILRRRLPSEWRAPARLSRR